MMIKTLTLVILLCCARQLCGQLKEPKISKDTPVGAIVITLTPFGPLPETVTRAEGPFVLHIENRAGLKQALVALTQNVAFKPQQDGRLPDKLHGTEHKDGKPDDQLVLDPDPGTYYLTVQDKPTWNVKLVITKK